MSTPEKGVAVMEANVFGRGGLSAGEKKEELKAHNLSNGSEVILRHAFFALAALEFFKNGHDTIFANDIRVKDESTGREFSFSLTAHEVT